MVRAFVVARRHAPGGTYIAIDVGHRYPANWGAHGRAYLAAGIRTVSSARRTCSGVEMVAMGSGRACIIRQ